MAQNKTEILAVLQLLRKYNYKVCECNLCNEIYVYKNDLIFVYRVPKSNCEKRQI